MILTISEDLTSNITLDSELTGISDSGMYLNSGVHPSITVDNLLSFLPRIEFVFTDYSALTTYNKFTDTRNRDDIVTYNGVIYQSISNSNIGNTPDVSPSEWLETDINSLRIKIFALNSQDNAIKHLDLNQRFLENQFLYNLVERNDYDQPQMLPNDYSAWVFEPKGSDYVTFTLNEVALQATTATPQNLYVINQGNLVTTLTLNPNADGTLVFEDLGYSFSGKGKWFFAIDSQEVRLDGSVVDLNKYESFVAYTATGTGTTPEGADYSYSQVNNGLNWNITTYASPSEYIDFNLVRFGRFLQASWQIDVLRMFLYNSNNRSNVNERHQLDINMLTTEVMNIEEGGFTSIKNFIKEKDKAQKLIDRTFDRQLIDNTNRLDIEESTL